MFEYSESVVPKKQLVPYTQLQSLCFYAHHNYNNYMYAAQVGFCSSDISTSVLFKANGEPAVVEVNVQVYYVHLH